MAFKRYNGRFSGPKYTTCNTAEHEEDREQTEDDDADAILDENEVVKEEPDSDGEEAKNSKRKRVCKAKNRIEASEATEDEVFKLYR